MCGQFKHPNFQESPLLADLERHFNPSDSGWVDWKVFAISMWTTRDRVLSFGRGSSTVTSWMSPGRGWEWELKFCSWFCRSSQPPSRRSQPLNLFIRKGDDDRSITSTFCMPCSSCLQECTLSVLWCSHPCLLSWSHNYALYQKRLDVAK